MLPARYPREQRSRAEEVAPEPKRETGSERWTRWAAMVAGGMTKAQVARKEGVSRAAVTIGLQKLERTES